MVLNTILAAQAPLVAIAAFDTVGRVRTASSEGRQLGTCVPSNKLFKTHPQEFGICFPPYLLSTCSTGAVPGGSKAGYGSRASCMQHATMAPDRFHECGA